MKLNNSRGEWTDISHPITERPNMWHRLPAFPNFAPIATQLVSMHTTACVFNRNWPKWGMLFAKTHARLRIERASQMLFLSDNHVFSDFSEAELLDMSLEDDA